MSDKRYLGNVPIVKFSRSEQNLSHVTNTTLPIGKLIPIDWQEVLPGDTFKSKMTFLLRSVSTFVKPVLDNLFLDVYSFFVPNRLSFNEHERVFGNPNPNSYTSDTLISYPSTTKDAKCEAGSVGDYLGLPVGVDLRAGDFSLLPFRGFARIWNEWFRNENSQTETFVQLDGATESENLNNLDWSVNNYMGKLPSVYKMKDIFSTCVPSPQKGEAVEIPFAGGTVPVLTSSESNWSSENALRWHSIQTGFTAGDSPLIIRGALQGSKSANAGIATASNTSLGVTSGVDIVPENLVADLSSLPGVPVNEQRYAFALQKMLERDTIYGSRYQEYLLGHFGVYSPDSRLQRSEYLCGARIPLNLVQATQTSQGTVESPLGNISAYAWTIGDSSYTKSFIEHGIVFTVACIRFKHSYAQGLDKKWTRLKREDFYDPLFATLGLQPVYASELYYDGINSRPGGTIFGYNEAWTHYRYNVNRSTGYIRPNVVGDQSVAIWSFCDSYSSVPTYNTFMPEDSNSIDRTLSVAQVQQQPFIFSFYFDLKAVRAMPLYSTPGLIDHH